MEEIQQYILEKYIKNCNGFISIGALLLANALESDLSQIFGGLPKPEFDAILFDLRHLLLLNG